MSYRALQAICSAHWAMQPEMLTTMIEIASRDNPVNLEALAAKLGRPLDNSYNTEVRDGCAIIPVQGPLFRRASWLAQVSGATSVEMMAKDFNQALENPGVHSILLEIDSPGGEINGISEFAKMISDARGKKPVYAFISGTGASGAYYIASAAEHICAAPMAVIGSVGVVATFRDTKERDEKAGIRNIQIVSSQSPDKRLDPSSDDGRQKVQSMVDDLAQVFIADVARNRGVEEDFVLENFGRGGVMVASRALEANMIDSVGTFEDLLASIQQRHMESRIRGSSIRAQPTAEKAEGEIMANKGMIARITAAIQAALENDPELKAEDTSEEVAPPAADSSVGNSAEAVQLKQQLEAERLKNIKLTAENWASGLIAANKMMPAQKESAIQAFINAAKADLAAGQEVGEGTQVAAIKSVFDAVTPHVLTQEVPTEAKAAVIKNVTSTPGVEGGEVSEARMVELMGKSPLGRSILESAAASHLANGFRRN